MCLYIGNKKPLVAKKDIVVYKYVESSDGNYKTPFHAFSVKVNALMVAEGGSGDITKENCEKYSIHGGAIHACTSSNDSEEEIKVNKNIKPGSIAGYANMLSGNKDKK